MDFGFSEEQEMLRSLARSVLNERCPPEAVARAAGSARGWDPGLWRVLVQLGWIGDGMSFLDEAVVFEELGRSLAPVPFFSTVALALPLLQRSRQGGGGTPGGPAPATLAWADGRHAPLIDALQAATEARPSRAGWSLTGDKHLVPDLAAASVVLVTASIDGELGVWGVDPRRAGVRVEARRTVDGLRRVGSLSLRDADAFLVAEPPVASLLAQSARRARAALALEAVGIAQRALDMGVAHARTRRQFGKVIGAYQAVSHKLADTYAETELARSLAYWAAWCVAEDHPEADAAVRAARSFAAEAAIAACERAIQVHGGMGFSWEHPLHHFYKRALWIEAFEGSGAVHRAHLAADLLDREIPAP